MKKLSTNKSRLNVKQSILFMAKKLVTKSVKQLKTTLVLKNNRKISNLREKLTDENEDNKESINQTINKILRALDDVKSIDHKSVGETLSLLSFGSKRERETLSSHNKDLDNRWLDYFWKHKRIIGTIEEFKLKIESKEKKRLEKRRLKQSQIEQTEIEKGSNLLRSRSINQSERRAAVFVSSLGGEDETLSRKIKLNSDDEDDQSYLNAADEAEISRRRKAKHERNIQNRNSRTDNPHKLVRKKSLVDLSIYKPKEERHRPSTTKPRNSHDSQTMATKEAGYHPSWIAKQKLKLQMKSIEIKKDVSNAKKIIFND